MKPEDPGLERALLDVVQVWFEELENRERRYFVATPGPHSKSVLRHKDEAGLRVWRERNWRKFGGTPTILDVHEWVRDALERMIREPYLPDPARAQDLFGLEFDAAHPFRVSRLREFERTPTAAWSGFYDEAHLPLLRPLLEGFVTLDDPVQAR